MVKCKGNEDTQFKPATQWRDGDIQELELALFDIQRYLGFCGMTQ